MKSARKGISLLEIILAIGILGGSLAALSSIVLIGADAALDARDRALAQLKCEHQMALLLVAGVQPMPVVDQPLPHDDPSTDVRMTIESQMAPLNGMLVVRVTVHVGPTDGSREPVAVSLYRWMIDPSLGLEAAEAAEEEAAAAAEESSSSAGTSGTSDTNTGGGP
jgi:hypothetical protein